MSTITAQAIIDKAQIILQDTTAVRWSESELLGWLNDGQREIVALRPDAYSKIANVTCVAGTKQSIPTSDGLRLLDVIRNMGAGGSTPGLAIRKVPRQIMDGQTPDWHSSGSSATIKHYVFDERAPKTFYVYPPATVGTQLEILYAAAPADVSAIGNTITLDDIYMTPLMDYILYRAYSKDTEYAGNANRAAAARQSFENTLGLKAQADAANVGKINVQG